MSNNNILRIESSFLVVSDYYTDTDDTKDTSNTGNINGVDGVDDGTNVKSIPQHRS